MRVRVPHFQLSRTEQIAGKKKSREGEENSAQRVAVTGLKEVRATATATHAAWVSDMLATIRRHNEALSTEGGGGLRNVTGTRSGKSVVVTTKFNVEPFAKRVPSVVPPSKRVGHDSGRERGSGTEVVQRSSCQGDRQRSRRFGGVDGRQRDLGGSGGCNVGRVNDSAVAPVISQFMASLEVRRLKVLESHAFGEQYDGASDDGLCGLHALRTAGAFLGLDLSWGSVIEYVAKSKAEREVDVADDSTSG